MFIFFIGSCLGSFLCLIAYRVPRKQPVLFSRSKCDQCHHILRYWELVPLLSWPLLGFACQQCKQRISAVFWAAEVIYGGLFWLIWSHPSREGQGLAAIWLTTAFLLSLTDIFYWLVEPKILYPLHLALWFAMFYFKQTFYFWSLLLALLFLLFFGCLKKEMLGLGDLILLIFWLPWLSLEQTAIMLLVASSTALFTFLGYRVVKKQSLPRLPFVPFLSIGLLVSHLVS